MNNTFLPYLNREINNLTVDEKFSLKMEAHPKERTLGVLPEELKMLVHVINKLEDKLGTLKEKRNLEIEMALLNQKEVTIKPNDKNHLEIRILSRKIETFINLLWIEIREHFEAKDLNKEMRIREGWKVVAID